MKDLLDYISLSLENDQKQFVNASEMLEYLYFSYIKPPLKNLKSSNEYKIAKDLIYLRKVAYGTKFDFQNIQTDCIKQVLEEYGLTSELTDVDIKTLKINIIAPRKYYITTIFIADVISRNFRIDRWRWITTSLIALIGVLAGLNWLMK